MLWMIEFGMCDDTWLFLLEQFLSCPTTVSSFIFCDEAMTGDLGEEEGEEEEEEEDEEEEELLFSVEVPFNDNNDSAMSTASKLPNNWSLLLLPNVINFSFSADE